MDCLGDNGNFSIVLNKNHLRCQSKNDSDFDSTFFKYHLVDDGIISESSVNVSTISKLTFDTEFEISTSKFCFHLMLLNLLHNFIKFPLCMSYHFEP